MDDGIKWIKCTFKIFLNFFYIYLLFAGTSQSAFSVEEKYNIFFAGDKILIEKENDLTFSPNGIPLNNLSFIDTIQGPQICKDLFFLSNHNLMIKDPSDKLKTYIECILTLKDSAKKNFQKIQIGINRTFMSWCSMRSKADIGIQKTIEAILNIVQATDCRDDSIKESLLNARMMNLAGQDIEDLSPIGSLTKLRALWLDNNDVSNLKPLSSLKNLIVLSLSNNHISDIQILESLKNLQWLFLSANLIEKIDSLSSLENIKVLSLKNNNILSIKPLLQFNTNTLILANGNPFQKDICKEFHAHKLEKKKLIWLEKLCNGESKKKENKLEGSSI